jgi:hypothetical protein
MKYSNILAIAVVTALSASARAGYVDARPQPPAPDLAAAEATAPTARPDSDAPVVYVGALPASIPPARGGARSFGVLDAVGQFAPADFKVKNAGADLSGTVDWSGSIRWTDTLASVMRASGNQATVDWNAHAILISRADKQARAADPVAESVPVAHTLWTVAQEDQWLIRDTLARWARDAGYQFVSTVGWDYPAQAYGSFEGDFESAALALIKSCAKTDRPIRGEISDDGRNKALTIYPFAN